MVKTKRSTLQQLSVFAQCCFALTCRPCFHVTCGLWTASFTAPFSQGNSRNERQNQLDAGVLYKPDTLFQRAFLSLILLCLFLLLHLFVYIHIHSPSVSIYTSSLIPSSSTLFLFSCFLSTVSTSCSSSIILFSCGTSSYSFPLPPPSLSSSCYLHCPIALLLHILCLILLFLHCLVFLLYQFFPSPLTTLNPACHHSTSLHPLLSPSLLCASVQHTPHCSANE